MSSSATAPVLRIAAKAVALAIAMIVSPLLFWIVNGLLLLLVQRTAGLDPFPMIWPAGPLWPMHVAIPAYFFAASCGAVAVHLIIATTIRNITNWGHLAVAACAHMFLFPLGLFGAFKTLFPSAGVFSSYDLPYLGAFLVLTISPYMSSLALRAADRGE